MLKLARLLDDVGKFSMFKINFIEHSQPVSFFVLPFLRQVFFGTSLIILRARQVF